MVWQVVRIAWNLFQEEMFPLWVVPSSQQETPGEIPISLKSIVSMILMARLRDTSVSLEYFHFYQIGCKITLNILYS